MQSDHLHFNHSHQTRKLGMVLHCNFSMSLFNKFNELDQTNDMYMYAANLNE